MTAFNARTICALFFLLSPCLQSAGVSARAEGTSDVHAAAMAAHVVQWSGAPGGICAVVGVTDADLALAVAKQGGFVVQALCPDGARCESVRKAVRAQGMYGPVSADTLPPGRLPYTDNLVNLVIVDSYPASAKAGPSPREILRVLAPLGIAYLGTSSPATSRAWAEQLVASVREQGAAEVSIVETEGTWVRMRKPWPEDIDQWTHYLHGPDGNPVARDRVVGPPKHYQWISGPTWLRCHETDSSVSTLVTARGRLFYIADEAPISLVGDHPLPDKWFLVARDAFNGVPLWKVPIRRWGWREWKPSWFNTRPGDIPLNIQKRLVAAGDKVYVTLGYRAPVSELDARTGEILKTYGGTEQTGEILDLDGTLILSVQDEKAVRVVAVEAASGKRLWASEKTYRGSTVDYIRWSERYGGGKPAELDPSLNLAADRSLVALIDGPEIVGLDFRTGREKWHAAFPEDESSRAPGGIQSHGNLWIGTMIVRDGVVIHASPSRLGAFDAGTGKLLWSQPKKYIGHLWYEWKDVFVIDGLVWTWSADLEQGPIGAGAKKDRELWPRSVNGYDLRTGELKKSVLLGSTFKANHHHRCYRNKATERFILASRRGSEFIDLAEGQHTIHNWVRGTCHVGMMPANGLQYAPPHPCVCYLEEKLNGMNVLAPARPDAESIQSPLDRGPAYGRTEGPDAAADDWPAFRHDSMRTGSVPAKVPDDLVTQWRVAVGTRVSPPIVAAGRLFVALIDEHHVACLDARTGVKLWEFAAGARIDSPPTYAKGAVVFGSADGWVYSLRAADGHLAWRFRGAPQSRQIGAFGQLESAWPIHGSVLLQNGTAYFAAGRSSHLDGGIYLYGLDAGTGQVRCRTRLEGPDYAAADFEENFGLPMGALPDILMGDGSKVTMRSEVFDGQLQRQRGRPSLAAKGGLLDDTYFKRAPWTMANEYARLIVHDSQSACYVRMFDSLRGLDPTVFFTPGSKGYLLFAKNMTGKRPTWSQRVPIRIRAMVLADGRLAVAGPPDVVEPTDPLGAFEARRGGLLMTIDAATGEKRSEQRLPSPPVFNGAVAAGGALYVAEEDGSITCFGKR